MEGRIPLIGEKFPEMKVFTTDGAKELPKDYKGKWLVLFSHPGDFTPVCTTEFVEFAKKHEDFKKINTELLGLSVDAVHSHIKWMEWIKDNLGVEITFPIIADTMGRVASRLGMVDPEKGSATVRAVFILDPEGTIRLIMYYPSEVGRYINEIYRAVKALQLADKNKVVTPANWPENSILGRKVIIPPASTYAEAMKRKTSDEEGYDWWLKVKEVKE
jgi:peroxiredoxin (alkyl hydroperoxide reductase subunit C)